MSEEHEKDPYLDWIPRRFSEKYRRYYVNHEVLSRDDIKKLERTLIRAFRYAFTKYYLAKGYRLAREVVENPEAFGPTPAIIWILFKDQDNYIVMVGDSSNPKKGDPFINIFMNEFVNRLREKKFDVIYADLVDLSSRFRWGDAQRFIYVRIRRLKPSEES